MKKKTKVIVSSALSIALCASMISGATFALFTDTAETNIAVTAGTVDVEANLSNLQTYSMGEETATQGTFDNGGSAAFTDDVKLDLVNITPGDKVTFDVTISNNSTVDIQYRLSWIVDGDLLGENGLQAKVGEDDLTNGTSAWTEWKASEASTPKKLTVSVELPVEAGNIYQEKTAEISFIVEAVQANGTALYSISSQTALAAALANGGKIVLNNNITLDETVVVPAGVTVELDLNGKTIESTVGRDADGNRIHTLVNKGNLVLTDGTVASKGNNGGSAIYNSAGATLTIEEDVTILGAPVVNDGNWPSYGINNYGYMIVNGATVKTYHGGIATADGAETIINDAEVDVGQSTATKITSYTLYTYGTAKLTVNGGSFANTATDANSTGGAIACEDGDNAIVINGGNFSGGCGLYGSYVISSGTFDRDVSTLVGERSQVVNNGNGTWTVNPHTVSSGDALIEAINSGKSVTLASDIVVSDTLAITADNAFIDGNGKTLTYSGAGRAVEISNNPDADIDVTIKNLVVDCSASYCERGINYNDNGTLTLDNVTVKGANMNYALNLPGKSIGATVVITDSSFTSAIPLNIWGANSTIISNNCEFTSVDNSVEEDYKAVVLNNDGAMSAEGTVITINGGKIIARDQNGNPSVAVANNTATGSIIISDTTEVVGEYYHAVATVQYGYDSFYSFQTLQAAVNKAIKDGNGCWVELTTDVTVDSIKISADVTIKTNGYTLTVGSYIGDGKVTVDDAVVYSKQ